MPTFSSKITPFLWYDTQAEAAANFYVSLFPDSRVEKVVRYGKAGPRPEGMVMTVEFVLAGLRFTALNGGPEHAFNEAVSFLIHCDDQAEVDRYWDALLDGGAPIACGWLKDRYGLRWQVVPKGFVELLSGPDAAGAQRAMQAMMGMMKLDLAALRRAYAGE